MANAFVAQNKFLIHEISWYISEYTPNLKTEEMLNRRQLKKATQCIIPEKKMSTC